MMTNPPARSSTSARTVVIAVIVDVAMLVLFAAMGRASHDEGSALGGTLTVAAPFIIAYVISAASVQIWKRPLSIARAAAAWFPMVILGMILRRLVFDRGTAPAFVIVAFITTGVLIVGWRALVMLFARARNA